MNNDYVYPFNGIMVDGSVLSIDPEVFILWAIGYHPEWVAKDFSPDNDVFPILVQDVVLTEKDAAQAGRPEYAGAVVVTLRPDLDGNLSWVVAAEKAAERRAADPSAKAMFLKLAQAFKDAGFDAECGYYLKENE